ncbi:hypothetical protein ACHQM5_016672 [Ranunculus cassubicifolius]
MATTTTPAVSQEVNATPVVAAPGAAVGSTYLKTSLYVGDLDLYVTDAQLVNLFSQVGQVVSVRICRDQAKNCSLGYGYVNFVTHDEAYRAMEILNFTPINGKPIRIMFSNRDPSIRKSGLANLFIKGLEPSIDNKALLDTFSKFGAVLSCKVATDSKGKSRGYGFVQFEQKEAAQNATKILDGKLLNDKEVKIEPFVRKQDREIKFTNVYVKNLCESLTKDDLDEKFKSFGPIEKSIVVHDKETGTSKGFGFVNFYKQEDADAAIANLNGFTHNDKVWYVGRAQNKADRQAELKSKLDQERTSKYEKLQGANLYLKNLDEIIDDQKLKELFSEFGTIENVKVMRDDGQQSKGTGFVAFSTPEDAAKAVNEMNGKLIGKKPLYVAVAQRKEERKAKLQAHFAQIRSPVSPIPYGMGGFHHAGHRVGPQHIYFGQGTPGSIPPHPAAGYGIQQPLLSGIRPGLVPNYVVPYHLQRQGQPGQRIGLRRGVTPQQIQQPPQFGRNPNQGMRYMANGINGYDSSTVSPQGLMNPIIPPSVFESGPVPTASLASALASATPDDQKRMLGEQLYPLVEKIEPVMTGKVTGMLLEIEPTEVLHLIESPDELKNKVVEAIAVLEKHKSGSDVAGQINSSSLNE